MKTNDNTTRLKTYKIKNHDSGQTFRVKAVSYTDAKMKYNQHILKDSITEDAISKLVQNYLGSKKPKTKAEQDEIINFLLEKNKITKEDVQKVRSLLKIVKDSLTEDADKSMGTYNGYSIKQNVDGNIYVLKKSGEKQFFESWKKAHEAIKTGAIKDSIIEDASFSNWLDKTAVLEVKPQIDSALSSFKKGGHSGTKHDDYSIYLFISFGPNKFELRYYYSTLLEKAIPSAINDKTSIVSDLLAKFNRITGANAKLEKTGRLTSRGKTEFLAKAESTGKRVSGNEYASYTPKAVELMFKKEKIDSIVKDSITEDADLTGKMVKHKGTMVKVLRKLTEQEKQKRANINNPNAGDYYEVEAGWSEHFAPNKFIVLGALLGDSLTEDASNIQISKSSKEFERVIREYHKKYGKILQVESMVYNFETGKYYMYNESTDYSFTSKRLSDSITEDADIAQNDIKSSYLPEDANADNIQYLGFNEKRKLSFYSYGDRYFVHYDLEGRTEEIDKATVQKILKKNILGEIDENDLINKEPQSEEIVSDSFEDAFKGVYSFKQGQRADAFKQYLRDRGLKFEPSQDGERVVFVVFNADEAVDRRANEIVRTLRDTFKERGDR